MIVFRHTRKSLAPAPAPQLLDGMPAIDAEAAAAIVQNKDGQFTDNGFLELSAYAKSVLQGDPDTQLETVYAHTGLADVMRAMRANHKIAMVYA